MKVFQRGYYLDEMKIFVGLNGIAVYISLFVANYLKLLKKYSVNDL